MRLRPEQWAFETRAGGRGLPSRTEQRLALGTSAAQVPCALAFAQAQGCVLTARRGAQRHRVGPAPSFRTPPVSTCSAHASHALDILRSLVLVPVALRKSKTVSSFQNSLQRSGKHQSTLKVSALSLATFDALSQVHTQCPRRALYTIPCCSAVCGMCCQASLCLVQRVYGIIPRM